MTKLIIALILSLLMNLVFGIMMFGLIKKDSLRVDELAKLHQTYNRMIDEANLRTLVKQLECDGFQTN